MRVKDFAAQNLPEKPERQQGGFMNMTPKLQFKLTFDSMYNIDNICAVCVYLYMYVCGYV